MRLRGIIKLLLILAADFGLAYHTLGEEAAIALTAGVAVYAWLGEYLALLKHGAIGPRHLREYEKNRLDGIMESLNEDVRQRFHRNISRLKVSVIPSDEINAYAYGWRNMAVTRALLNNCDDATVCAVLGHEVSHILSLDAVASRMVFASMTVVLAGLIVTSFVSVSFIWIIFAMLCALRICGGLFSMFLFRGFSSLIKGAFTLTQHGVVIVYQTVMGLVSRSCEYRADRCSCQLGYGSQLSYFLSRFVEGQQAGTRSLSDLLYASHPAPHKRIFRIEQRREETGLATRDAAVH